MSRGSKRDRQRLLGWMTLLGGVFVLLFWALYFSRAVDLGQHDPAIHAFESAFPLADAVFAVVLFTAAYHLLKGKRTGWFFLVVAGSMSLYLGVLDTTFYVSHGIFSAVDVDALVGLSVNAFCIGGGMIALRFGWRSWNTPAEPRRSEFDRRGPGERRSPEAREPRPSDQTVSRADAKTFPKEVAA